MRTYSRFVRRNTRMSSEHIRREPFRCVAHDEEQLCNTSTISFWVCPHSISVREASCESTRLSTGTYQ